MTSNGQCEPADELDLGAQRFVLWCLEAMGLHVTSADNGVHVIEIPAEPARSSTREAHEPHRYAELAGRRFTFHGTSDNLSRGVESLSFQSPLVCWLFDQLKTEAWPVHAAAAKQPVSVHELTRHLFAQYRVDEGHIYLGGCSLEERPFLRLTYVDSAPASGQPQLTHCYGTSDGELLDDVAIKEMDLDDLVPWTGRAPRLDSGVLRRWTEVTRQQFERTVGGQLRAPIATTLVWCKHAEGKLTFSIGRRSVEVQFSGWARLLVDRKILPPPYVCPLSGRSSYHLAATDDGRISAADAVEACGQSGQRVLASELETCAETGVRVLPEYLQKCPVTGNRVLSSVLTSCSLCHQKVSPQSLELDRCPACRHLVATSKTDPHMARILDAHPKLDRWRSWKAAESEAVHVLIGASTWKRLLVVLDKQTLDVLYVAISGRFSSKWTSATDVQRADWVG